MGAPRELLALAALACSLSAYAQYSFNIGAEDEQGIKYFGAAKDSHGTFLSDVTIVIDSGQFSYVLVSNNQGRYKLALPFGTQLGQLSFKCMKAGYQQVRVIKRPSPSTARPAVQIDCELEALDVR